MSSTNDSHRNHGNWKMFSEDLEPRKGILSQVEENTEVLGIRNENLAGV